MNYYVIRVKYLKDGTIKKSEVMDYATENDAIKKFYTNLSTDMGDDTLSGSMCCVVNLFGNIIKSDYWGYITQSEE